MVQITRTGILPTNDNQLSIMREQFRERQSLCLPSFIDSTLLDPIIAAVQNANFDETRHLDCENRIFARDHTIDGSNLAVHVFHFMLNNPELFKIVQSITDCPGISSFSGRIYRSVSNSDHHLSWHDDLDQISRLIGISINFSKAEYSGGIFQIRDKRSRIILNEISNTETGGAIIFQISPNLEHRITQVKGDTPKIAGAGWFLSDSNYFSTFKSRVTGSNADDSDNSKERKFW